MSAIVDTNDPRAVLRAAADYIEQHGWVQEGYYSTFDGGVTLIAEHRDDGCAACAMGAIRIVTGAHLDGRDNVPFYNLLTNELERRGESGHELSIIHEWNDAPERTADEVISVLRAAGSES